MRALHLDFVRADRLRLPAYVLLAAGLASSVWLVREHQAVSAETTRYTAQLSVEQQRRAPPQRAVDPREARVQEERYAGAAAVLDRLNVPWDRLFRALESARDDEVALLKLSPDADKRQLRMQLEAKTLEAMLRYHHALETTGAFEDVALIDHEVQKQDAQQPVRFNIGARWKLDRGASN